MPYFFFSSLHLALFKLHCQLTTLFFLFFAIPFVWHLSSLSLALGYLGLVLRDRSLWIAFLKFLTFGFALILCDIFIFVFHFLHSCFYSEFLNMFLSCVFAFCNVQFDVTFIFVPKSKEVWTYKPKKKKKNCNLHYKTKPQNTRVTKSF